MPQYSSTEKPSLLSVWFKGGHRNSEYVLRDYGHWEPPDEAAARSQFLLDHQHHEVFSLGAKTKELKEFGEGLLLYFYFLKATALLFAGLAVLPGLLLVSVNALGGWYSRADIERTMLGNYGLLSFNGRSTGLNATSGGHNSSAEGRVSLMFMSDFLNPPAQLGNGWDKRSTLVTMSAIDLLGVLVFFGWSMFMVWFMRMKAAATDEDLTTIRDYAVRVDSLPPDADPGALRAYMLKLAGGEDQAEVVEVELCRHVGPLVDLVVARGNALQRLELATAQLQRHAEVFPKVPKRLLLAVARLQAQVAELTLRVAAEQQRAGQTSVVAGFVTFGSADARIRCLQALPRSKMHQYWLPPEKRYINRPGSKPLALTLRAAPEPSDIKYEHLEYGPVERVSLTLLTSFAKYLVLCAGFVLINFAPAIRVGLVGAGSAPYHAQCDATCDYVDNAGNYRLNATNRPLYKGCDPVDGSGTLPNKLDCEATAICYECYCRAALNARQYSDGSYCDRFSGMVALSTASQALAVLGIVVVNFAAQWSMGWLSSQERHHTRSAEARSHARGLWMVQFINTAFSSLVANMYLPGAVRIIHGSFLDGLLFTGTYADTTPNWYRDVARPVAISLFITTLIAHARLGLRYWWWARAIRNRHRCLTQAQLQEDITGHEFELADKYGTHLYFIFVTMTYSSAIPLLYILAALHFASCYWAEKFELLRVCKRPLAYSRDLALYASTTVPFAALWHLAFALWCFSLFGVPQSPLATRTFVRGMEATLRSFRALMADGSNLTPTVIARRITQDNAAHLLIFFIICAGSLFIFLTLETWIRVGHSLASLAGLIPDTGAKAGEVSSVPEFSIAVRSQLLVGPATYAIQRNPNYAHAFERMEDEDLQKLLAVPSPTPGEEDSSEAQTPSTAAGEGTQQQQPQLQGGMLSRMMSRKSKVRQKVKERHKAKGGHNRVAPAAAAPAAARAPRVMAVASAGGGRGGVMQAPPPARAAEAGGGRGRAPAVLAGAPDETAAPDARFGAWD